MKKFGSLFVAAILGSAITMGTFTIFDKDDGKTFKIEHVNSTPSSNINYAGSSDLAPMEFTSTAEKVMPAVVHIKSTVTSQITSRGPQFNPFRDFFGEDDLFERFFGPQVPQQRGPQTRVGTGSGVIVNSEGYIVTNNHVIENAADIEVTLYDNRTYKAKIIGTDPTTDLALIQIKEKDLPAVPFTNSDVVKVGQWVLAVGNPFNLTSTVTAGIVSAKGRDINILRQKSRYAIESFIQTDAAINPGNSGGALVDMSGNLVGINTAIASPTGAYSGYGFAVPANIVSKVIEDLRNYGVVQRGMLGITIRDINSELAKEKDLNLYEGVYVDSVTENSGAEDAGIKPGDVVVSINNKKIKNSAELMGIIASQRPGDKVNMLVNRDGKEKSFEVTLKNRNGSAEFIAKEETKALAALGASFETIDKDLARKLEIDGGVKVTELGYGKLRQNTDMKEGFIITKVDNKPVKSVEELTEVLNNKKGGVMLEGIYENYPGKYYYAFGL